MRPGTLCGHRHSGGRQRPVCQEGAILPDAPGRGGHPGAASGRQPPGLPASGTFDRPCRRSLRRGPGMGMQPCASGVPGVFLEIPPVPRRHSGILRACLDLCGNPGFFRREKAHSFPNSRSPSEKYRSFPPLLCTTRPDFPAEAALEAPCKQWGATF